jgi:hypothetical protein
MAAMMPTSNEEIHGAVVDIGINVLAFIFLKNSVHG